MVRRDEQIRIERNTITQDNDGNNVDAWSLHAIAWGSFRAASAREFITAGIEAVTLLGAFETDYVDGVKAHMRIPYKGRHYDIEGVVPGVDPASGVEYLTLPVSEVRFD